MSEDQRAKLDQYGEWVDDVFQLYEPLVVSPELTIRNLAVSSPLEKDGITRDDVVQAMIDGVLSGLVPESVDDELVEIPCPQCRRSGAVPRALYEERSAKLTEALLTPCADCQDRARN